MPPSTLTTLLNPAARNFSATLADLPPDLVSRQVAEARSYLSRVAEPMVNAGAHPIRMASDNWSVYSQDGSLAAHFEHTVAITAEGPRILTPWHLQEARRAA